MKNGLVLVVGPHPAANSRTSYGTPGSVCDNQTHLLYILVRRVLLNEPTVWFSVRLLVTNFTWPVEFNHSTLGALKRLSGIVNLHSTEKFWPAME